MPVSANCFTLLWGYVAPSRDPLIFQAILTECLGIFLRFIDTRQIRPLSPPSRFFPIHHWPVIAPPEALTPSYAKRPVTLVLCVSLMNLCLQRKAVYDRKTNKLLAAYISFPFVTFV